MALVHRQDAGAPDVDARREGHAAARFHGDPLEFARIGSADTADSEPACHRPSGLKASWGVAGTLPCGRDFMFFLCSPKQFPVQTVAYQPVDLQGSDLMTAQEGSREHGEKNGGKCARNGDFRRATLKRPRRETAPTLGERAKKIPTDKGWDSLCWWRRGISNN